MCDLYRIKHVIRTVRHIPHVCFTQKRIPFMGMGMYMLALRRVELGVLGILLRSYLFGLFLNNMVMMNIRVKLTQINLRRAEPYIYRH